MSEVALVLCQDCNLAYARIGYPLGGSLLATSGAGNLKECAIHRLERGSTRLDIGCGHAGPSFVSPYWSDNGQKHIPAPNTPWKQVLISTRKDQRAHAKYHPLLGMVDIEVLEMGVVRSGFHENSQFSKAACELFWREITGLTESIGASEGQATNYVYVEYHSSGAVHGRPITKRELRQKGAIV